MPHRAPPKWTRPGTEAIGGSSPAEADATASAVATPDTPAEADTPPPIVPLTAGPTGPAVSVVGPLLIISERVGAEEASDDHETEIRRVSLYDVGTDKYWSAFDHRNVRPTPSSVGRSAVQRAGTHLVVWSMGQVARVALNGQIETVLFEDAEIRTIEISPDGTKVAVLYGEPGTLVVLDATTGAEQLRLGSADPALGPLQHGGHTGQLSMGDWHMDGNALSITADDYGADLTAILGLDGSIRVLPGDWSLSPDLRYALKFGQVIDLGPHTRHAPVWDRWDVRPHYHSPSLDPGRIAGSQDGGACPLYPRLPDGRVEWASAPPRQRQHA